MINQNVPVVLSTSWIAPPRSAPRAFPWLSDVFGGGRPGRRLSALTTEDFKNNGTVVVVVVVCGSNVAEKRGAGVFRVVFFFFFSPDTNDVLNAKDEKTLNVTMNTTTRSRVRRTRARGEGRRECAYYIIF